MPLNPWSEWCYLIYKNKFKLIGMFKLKAFILFFVYIYPIFLTSWSLINLKGRLHVSKNIVSMYGIMEQVWHANGLMAQWHSPPYVRFSSRGQIPLSIRKKEKEKEKSVALIRLEVGPWCNGKCLPPKLMSHMFKSRNQHLPPKKKKKKKMLVNLPINHLSQTPQSGCFVH